jgi:hypothetical protein
MILNSRNDRFRFQFTRGFFTKEVNNYENYERWLNSKPRAITEPLQYLNASIQSISLPEISYTPVEQNRGVRIQYGSPENELNYFPGQFDVIFSLSEGFLNYWMLLYIYNFHNDHKRINNKTLFIEPQRIDFIDYSGNTLNSIFFREILFFGLSGITADYSDASPEFKTITASFSYNSIEFKPFSELKNINEI